MKIRKIREIKEIWKATERFVKGKAVREKL